MACSLAGDVDAKRKGKRKAPAQEKVAVVTNAENVKALGELMGDFKFGMSKKEVLKILAKDVKARFKEQISATTDVYTQDKLRQKQKKEVKRIEKSFVKFKGKKSGWDVSIIDDQFAHETGESMMVFWENDPETGKNQRRFFFFHEGQLYKMFIALKGSMLQEDQRSFEYFRTLMEGRYGKGTDRVVEKRSGEKVLVGADWNTKKYHVSALDKLSFYDSFVLVIANPLIESAVADMRAAKRKAPKGNAVIDSVMEKDSDLPSLDSGKGAIDKAIK
jgi:hypothetical protein